jgi:IS5 family transposase
VQRKGYRDHPLSASDLERNKEIAVSRSTAERPFATYKRLYGLARTRVMGLNKIMTFYGLAAMASNIRKGAEFLTLHGVRRSVPTG